MLSANVHRDPLASALIRRERDGARGGNYGRVLGEGDGWRALDVVCTAGPRDRPFEERHAWSSISLVLVGTFAYRSARRAALMSPGAMVLGSFGRSFECSHQHSFGDRCLSFQFSRELFDVVARDAGASRVAFDCDRMPPLRALAPLSARAVNAIFNPAALEEIGLELAGAVIRMDGHRPVATTIRDRKRIADVLNHLETNRDDRYTLADLASLAGVSRYHFLRTFRSVTSVTPHQWILRARLREAAQRLAASREAITEIALDVGFDDLSNFIRSFRAEFGVSPRRYRAAMA